MGHTWREMDPQGAARQDAFMQRHLDMREKLRHQGLSSFTAEDVPHLATLFSFIGLPSNEQAVKHFEARERESESSKRLEK